MRVAYPAGGAASAASLGPRMSRSPTCSGGLGRQLGGWRAGPRRCGAVRGGSGRRACSAGGCGSCGGGGVVGTARHRGGARARGRCSLRVGPGDVPTRAAPIQRRALDLHEGRRDGGGGGGVSADTAVDSPRGDEVSQCWRLPASRRASAATSCTTVLRASLRYNTRCSTPSTSSTPLSLQTNWRSAEQAV